MRKEVGMRGVILRVGACLILLNLAAPAQAVTQRRINTLAAYLYETNRALVDEPGIRRPEEPLPAYFGRLLARQPGEKPGVRHARVTAYLTFLTQTVDRTSSLRTIPSLHTTTAANRTLWQQIGLNLADVAAYLAKARIDWTHEEATPGVPSATARNVAQAIWHIQNAYAALRDALP
jgi:hypothetical protein